MEAFSEEFPRKESLEELVYELLEQSLEVSSGIHEESPGDVREVFPQIDRE